MLVLRSPARKPSRGRPTDRPPRAACFPFSRVCFISHFLFLLSRVLHSFLPSSRSRAVQPEGRSGLRRRRAPPENVGLPPTYSSLHRRISVGTFERLRAGALE
ncbi:hypothetical protein PVAP13_9KG381201 [Panicum virgatum]|uniref:Uncharacterized protein n=1 Tax=Panicum virgatum TaxID=38727 RepID=A0A8T0NRL1_PANVG|nr:hypothetical protein PVAP13_9KG381201 [Panicum virgatum]